MNLIDALELLKEPGRPGAREFRVFLGCSFTPLHLNTFLAALLLRASPPIKAQLTNGLFGDLAGSLERLTTESIDAAAVIIEWEDLDPRLGIRSLGGWRVSDLVDIIESAEHAAVRLTQGISRISKSIPVGVSVPSLPIPPVFYPGVRQAGAAELRLRRIVAALAEQLAGQPGISLVSSQHLDEISPANDRFDAKSAILAGFPYTLGHASAMADSLAALLGPTNARKGLITDLDDTLWSGLLGEVGPEGISWDSERRSHMHALYQQFLSSLASAGILLAVASKNNPAVVEQAFERNDLLIPKVDIFPVEANWNAKSQSVARILSAWNIGPEATVFVDDSPLELAEVKAAFPEIECLVFPSKDYQAVWQLLRRLRELFGKNSIREEDKLRLASIRNAGEFREAAKATRDLTEEFLKGVDASITFTLGVQAGDARALELMNKTNQFNLNGKRFNKADWRSRLDDPQGVILAASYRDKFGALGKIAVLTGSKFGRQIVLDGWVMSCRAFSRRIEYQCLRYLFETLDADQIVLAHEATSRNGPILEFFTRLIGLPLGTPIRIERRIFFERVPPLYHLVQESPK